MSLSITIEPSEHVLYDGVLSGIPVGRLHSSEQSVIEVGMSFIAEGQFTVQAQAFTMVENGLRTSAGIGETTVVVREESLNI